MASLPSTHTAFLRATALLVPLIVLVSCATDVPMKPLQRVRVYGTIRDAEGNGAPEVRLTLLVRSGRYETSASWLSTETDSVGNFQLSAPEGEYFPELRTEDRLPHVTLGPLRVKAPSTRLDYRYGGHRVSGTITDHGGALVDSGRVTVESVNAATYDQYVYIRVPIAAGHYATYLPTGEYSFWFTSEGPAGAEARNFIPVAIATDTTWDVSLGGHAVTGTVTLGAGTPLAGASVVAGSSQAYALALTDPSGNYALYLPSGDYDWSVTPGPSNSNTYRLFQSGPGISGPAVLDFDLSGVRWSGVVRMAPTNDPVSGARVYVNYEFVYPDVVSTSDAAGHFDLILRPSSRYSLRVEAPGAFPLTVGGVLAGNDSTFDLTVSPANP